MPVYSVYTHAVRVCRPALRTSHQTAILKQYMYVFGGELTSLNQVCFATDESTSCWYPFCLFNFSCCFGDSFLFNISEVMPDCCLRMSALKMHVEEDGTG